VDYKFCVQVSLGNPAQVFLYDCGFNLKLMVITGVLIMAASTTKEIRTLRVRAMGRWFNHTIGPGPGKALLVFDNGRLDFFALKHEGHERCLGASLLIGREASKAIAAVNQFFDGEKQEMI
jgi:hypothetical protein